MLALLGPSGSGKTTTLRLLAGFEVPDAGRVLVENDDVTAVEPVRRRFGMVFQHYALFPHLDVGENVAFGLESLGVRGDALNDRVARALALVDLAGYERRRVGQLSGGQQQRVALARALAPEPRVLLLDEPLSNLDPTLRERTRRELKSAIQRVGITTVLVTHEQEEAFHLGDRVAVLQDGVLHQVGSPEDLYERPATRFVATFVGRASVLPCVLEGDGAVWVPDPPSGAAGPVRWSAVRSPEVEGLEPGGEAALVVRPESLAFVGADDPQALAGRVIERRYAGRVPSSGGARARGGGGGVWPLPGAAGVGEGGGGAPAPAGPAPRIFRRAG